MSLKEQAFRVAVLGALKDAIATEWAEQRGGLLDELLAAQDTLGVKSLDVSLPDGTKVATVTLTQPTARVDVVDEAAFASWVGANYPTEVETVTTVRPAFRKVFMERVVIGDNSRVFDHNTGLLIAGMRARPPSRPSSFSVRYTPEGRPAIADAWRHGDIPHVAVMGAVVLPPRLEGGA